MQMAPIFMQARSWTTVSGTMGMYMPTVSPLPMPSWAIPLAHLVTCSWSSM